MATKFLSPEAQFRAVVNMREDRDESPDPAASASTAPAAAAPAPAPKAVAPKMAVSTPQAEPVQRPKGGSFAAIQNQADAPPCSLCGSIMVRSGSCYKCANCGTTSGCA
jgi:ribonucleoside-diphosphate reductase alpha chain